jgi:hypothetical protein
MPSEPTAASPSRIKGVTLSHHTGNDPVGPTGRLMGRFRISRETYERTMRAFGKEPKRDA